MNRFGWGRQFSATTMSRFGRVGYLAPLFWRWQTGGRKIVVLYLLLIDCLQQTHAQSGGTRTFFYTGAVQTYSVPAGVTLITVTAAGAQGGQSGIATNISSHVPGYGGEIMSTVSVTPLTTLYVYVGGAGRSGLNTNKGGFNGGGNSSFYTTNSWGGGGGGASDVRTVLGSLDSRLVVAGGGGGELKLHVVVVYCLLVVYTAFHLIFVIAYTFSQ